MLSGIQSQSYAIGHTMTLCVKGALNVLCILHAFLCHCDHVGEGGMTTCRICTSCVPRVRVPLLVAMLTARQGGDPMIAFPSELCQRNCPCMDEV